MKHSLTPQALAELTTFASPPCLSLYQPTYLTVTTPIISRIRFASAMA